MAQTPSISFTNSKGKEYCFILDGDNHDRLYVAFIVGMFAFVILGSVAMSVAGFATGNLIIGIIGLTLFVAPFAILAFATKVTRS